jgi:hypothetical protein
MWETPEDFPNPPLPWLHTRHRLIPCGTFQLLP